MAVCDHAKKSYGMEKKRVEKKAIEGGGETPWVLNLGGFPV